jgi:hypothetical protein
MENSYPTTPYINKGVADWNYPITGIQINGKLGCSYFARRVVTQNIIERRGLNVRNRTPPNSFSCEMATKNRLRCPARPGQI